MQFIVVSCKRSRPEILEAIFSLSFLFFLPPGPRSFLFFMSDCASEIALAMAAAVLTGRLTLFPVPELPVSSFPVPADDDEVEFVPVGGGAAGGGVDEFESVIGTSLESSNELCFPNRSAGLSLKRIQKIVVNEEMTFGS